LKKAVAFEYLIGEKNIAQPPSSTLRMAQIFVVAIVAYSMGFIDDLLLDRSNKK
jgi:hypothetical protein